jgi:hypothetical protein
LRRVSHFSQEKSKNLATAVRMFLRFERLTHWVQ